MFNRKGPFEANVRRLEEALGMKCEEVPLKVVHLFNQSGAVRLLTAQEGSYKSIALLYWLLKMGGARGRGELYISQGLHTDIQKFYGPLWDEPDGKHPTIDFLRYPGIQVKVIASDYRLQEKIEALWDAKNNLPPIGSNTPETMEIIRTTLHLLDHGVYRVASPVPKDGKIQWETNDWLKKAILLSFRVTDNKLIGNHFDKVPLKTAEWQEPMFRAAGFRSVPGSVIRHGAYVGSGVIVMAGGFVNIGAYVGEGTMVDGGARVGSCAQIGKRVHISGGAGIGGVLEPPQATPVIIDDECFIGANSEVAEGVIVRRRAVLSMGVFIGKNTPIVDRTSTRTNDVKIIHGEVPEGAVVMMGVHPTKPLICPQIVKYRDEKTDAATALNEFLR